MAEGPVTVIISRIGKMNVDGKTLVGAFIEFPNGAPSWSFGVVFGRKFFIYPDGVRDAGDTSDQTCTAVGASAP